MGTSEKLEPDRETDQDLVPEQEDEVKEELPAPGSQSGG